MTGFTVFAELRNSVVQGVSLEYTLYAEVTTELNDQTS